MLLLFVAGLAFFLGYLHGKNDERIHSKKMIDTYLGTVEKMEDEFQRRMERERNKPKSQ